MPVALQIRNVPESTRDALAAAAQQEGKSLQNYLLDLLLQEERMLRNPDVFARTAELRVHIPDHLAPDRIIRKMRGPLPEDEEHDGEA